jgi:AAA domain, putative AbiEii toxin, Type IV TA system
MADPYRSFDDARSPRARVLGGPNRLRTAWHLVLLAGLLGFAAWVATTPFGQRMPWLVALFAAPVVLDVVRTVHEAVLPHRIIADDRGVELVWAEKAPWRPFMRRRSAAIAWDELLVIEEPEVSVHVGAAGFLYDVLRQAAEKGTVLLTTHSADLLDAAADDEILVCEYAGGVTRVGRLAAAQRQVVRDGLFSLAELMRSEPLRMES